MTEKKAGRTVSVRMDHGEIEELKAATGQPFSRLVRWTMKSLLVKLRAERNRQMNAQTQMDTAMEEIAQDALEQKG